MLALCLMLSGTYYAKNYAGIIGRGLACNLWNKNKVLDSIVNNRTIYSETQGFNNESKTRSQP